MAAAGACSCRSSICACWGAPPARSLTKVDPHRARGAGRARRGDGRPPVGAPAPLPAFGCATVANDVVFMATYDGRLYGSRRQTARCFGSAAARGRERVPGGRRRPGALGAGVGRARGPTRARRLRPQRCQMTLNGFEVADRAVRAVPQRRPVVQGPVADRRSPRLMSRAPRTHGPSKETPRPGSRRASAPARRLLDAEPESARQILHPRAHGTTARIFLSTSAQTRSDRDRAAMELQPEGRAPGPGAPDGRGA